MTTRLTAQPIPGGEHLPFPPTPSGSVAGVTMQQSIHSPHAATRRLPSDASNVVIVLIDDAGPGLPSPLGGEVRTPNLARVLGE